MRASHVFFAATALAPLLTFACADSDPATPAPSGTTAATTGGGTTGPVTSAGGSGGEAGSGGAAEGGGPITMTGDPCSNQPDGSYCGGFLGGNADHSSAYECAGGITLAVQGCPAGCADGACVEVPDDPCASAQSGNGLYCGGTLPGGDASALYDCQGARTASTTTCPAGCKVNPPGVADACNPEGDPCENATSGDGLYCGGSLGGGDANVLYDCAGQATAGQTTCPSGCQMNPPGTPDACAPTGSGACCLNAPPGVVTQSFSACGLGGSHYGIDYGTATGTPIYAGISGTVVSSALGYPNCYSGGCTSACWNAFNFVKLKSDCGDPDDPSRDLFVYYLHIDGLAPGVANGSHVDQGALLAYSGNSGCSSGPHIHLETVSVPLGQPASLNTCASQNPASAYCP